jgi:small subunit ribosomal protein S29
MCKHVNFGMHLFDSNSNFNIIVSHKDGIPTLDTLAKMNLPTSYPSHPARGDPQPYLKHRKRTIKDNIYKAVVEAGKPRVEKILSMEDWNAKQDAIDVLFEEIHDLVKIKDGQKNNSDISGEGDDNEYLGIVLASQPNFPKLVELALEEYLRNVVKNEKNQNVSEENDEDDSNNAYEPIFMDLLKGGKTKVDDENHVPEILNPIKPHPKDGPGRMLEEWELSANQNTKRIMCRKCISDIAEVVQSNDSGNNRVFVHGSKGAGKSAALAAIVASARISGHIVLYLPDGKRLSRNGFYVEPSAARGANGEVMFDLPILTNEVCGELLTSHEKDFDGMIVPDDVVKKYLSSDQIIKLEKKVQINDGGYNLIELLKVGSENTSIGGGCFGAVINSIMNQNEKTFTVVMDEFNCYFEQGYYFHQEYKNASKSIPANRMTLFQPLMDVIGVEQQDDGSFSAKDPLSIKNGSIVVGVSDSHAVAVKTNKALEVAIQSVGCKLVNVPQYSPVEVEHVLANFEIIGLGKLRFDRGATVMNRQEVAYLRMISGGIGQRLLDACIMP